MVRGVVRVETHFEAVRIPKHVVVRVEKGASVVVVECLRAAVPLQKGIRWLCGGMEMGKLGREYCAQK